MVIIPNLYPSIYLGFLILKTAVLAEFSWSHFDELRINKSSLASPIFDGENYIGRNLHRIDVSMDESDEDHDSLLFCHVPMFLQYSVDGHTEQCNIAYSASAGAMLAIQHFNNGNGVVVPELKGIHKTCNIRFTSELFDTASSPLEAVRQMTRILSRPSDAVDTPQPCSVVGGQYSDVTSKLATLSSVFDIFQISSSAMSTDLENNDQYPLLARTHTDVAGFGEMSVSYLQSLNITNFAVLFPNDSYGLGFQKSVLEEASKFGMTTVSSPYLVLKDEDEFDIEIQNALQVLKDSGFNYIIGAFYPDCLTRIMGHAYDMDIAGPSKLWLISGTADLAPITLSGKLIMNKDSSAAKALQGNGIFFCKGGIPGVGGSYDSFSAEWKRIGQTTDSLDYVNEKQPPLTEAGTKCSMPPTFFDALPHHIVTFTYDALVAMGLSACNLLRNNSTTEVFTGLEHRNSFFGMSNKFRGASGDFQLRQSFPTRTADSSYFVMVNLKQKEINDTHISFQKSPLNYYWDTENTLWARFRDNEWVYPDGTKFPPVEMEVRNENRTKFWLPILISIAITCLVSIVALWYIRKRHNQIDSLWSVKMEELDLDDNKIIGRGTFGLVLLGTYRGTEVACKRVIPSKQAYRCGVEARPMLSHKRDSTHNIDHESYTNQTPGQERAIHNSKKLLSHNSRTFESFDEEIGHNYSLTKTGSRSNMTKSSGLLSAFTKTFKDEHACMRDDFLKEMRILSKLRHPCITTVMGAVLDGIHEPMLIMEYMEHGSLFDIIHNKTMRLDGEIMLPLLRDISSGMRFLHAAIPQVIHGDLKAANVLVDKNMRAKIADFGLTQKQKLGATGTPYWMSPELLRDESCNTSASDVYSFGIVLYEVAARKFPYDGEDFNTVISEIKNAHKRPIMPTECPSTIKAMMEECVVDDPLSRPSFDEIDSRLRRIDIETVIMQKDSTSRNRGSLRRSSAIQRTDDLLFDVFPRHIAEALRDGKKVEPEERDQVTIFFSDIVGFTNISATLTPLQVSEMLDRLYHRFDELSRKHDVFKVETIGDAYMVCTNLVRDQPDHAKRIAQFSIDVLAAANKTLIDPSDPSKGCLDLRIGFHTGPVVANVVGSRNPRYCLFGDTVNTASRMESNSQNGKIHCSDAAARCLKEQDRSISLKSRGWIKVKGKGEMKTFWVNEVDGNDC